MGGGGDGGCVNSGVVVGDVGWRVVWMGWWPWLVGGAGWCLWDVGGVAGGWDGVVVGWVGMVIGKVEWGSGDGVVMVVG